MRNTPISIMLQVAREAVHNDFPFGVDNFDNRWFYLRERRLNRMDLAIKHYGSKDDLSSVELEELKRFLKASFDSLTAGLDESIEGAKNREDPDYIPF